MPSASERLEAVQRGLREMQSLGDGDEITQMPQLHHATIPCIR